MNNALSLPPVDDLDTQMRKVARALALDIYPLPDILRDLNVDPYAFQLWSTKPRFLEYLKTERDAWTSAANTPERVKLKAGIIMEEYMVQAHTELRNATTPLNQRVELAKLIAKMSGIGEQKSAVGGSGSGFQLNINIGPGAPPVIVQASKIHQHDDEYDPFTSPVTLEE